MLCVLDTPQLLQWQRERCLGELQSEIGYDAGFWEKQTIVPPQHHFLPYYHHNNSGLYTSIFNQIYYIELLLQPPLQIIKPLPQSSSPSHLSPHTL